MRTTKEGRRYLTKGEYRNQWHESWRSGHGPDLCVGETFDQWFETLMEALMEDGSARRVGNHYEVYLDT